MTTDAAGTLAIVEGSGRAVPRALSEGPEVDAADISGAELGARLLGLPLFEQGRNVARVLEARTSPTVARFTRCVIELPRRATKTTSVWATIIGRAMQRPGYRCVTTATTGTVASRILLEHAEALIREGNAVESRDAGRDVGARVVLYRTGGRERLEFPNGSRIWVVPPEAGAVRSAAADDILIDEGGEFGNESGQRFLTGVLPLMDTRGGLSQLIMAGTPGETREGKFWDMLEDGRSGRKPRLGIVDYSAEDHDDPLDEDVWWRVHPGLSSWVEAEGRWLTTIDVLRERLEDMGARDFAREYLCIWPTDAATRWEVVPEQSWLDAEMPGDAPALPRRFGLAYDVEPDDSAAALAAAWRDEDGYAHVVIVDARDSVAWLSRYAHAVARKYHRRIRYDGIGANHGVARAITKRRSVEVEAGSMRDAVAACSGLVAALANDELVHYGQATLSESIEGAVWRETEGGRLFARRAALGKVSPVMAAALALYEYDTMDDELPFEPIVVARRA